MCIRDRHQRVYDRMVKQFKLDSKKTYPLAAFRKAIGQAPKASSVSKKSPRAGKTLTGTAGKTSADPHAVVALKSVLAGKSVKVTETALRG